MIAPYWADVDTRAAGGVYYKNSVSRSEWTRAGRLISSTYRTNFRPTSLYIVTWYRVGAYSRSRSPVCFMFIVHINFAFVDQPQYKHVPTVELMVQRFQSKLNLTLYQDRQLLPRD